MLRCWKCGRECRPEEMKRRNVTTAHVFDIKRQDVVGAHERVDLCPKCAAWEDMKLYVFLGLAVAIVLVVAVIFLVKTAGR